MEFDVRYANNKYSAEINNLSLILDVENSKFFKLFINNLLLSTSTDKMVAFNYKDNEVILDILDMDMTRYKFNMLIDKLVEHKYITHKKRFYNLDKHYEVWPNRYLITIELVNAITKPVPHKRCNVCGSIKEVTEYRKNGGRYRGVCKACEKNKRKRA